MNESINEPGLALVQGPECEPGRPFSRSSRGTLHGARLFQTLALGGGGGGGGGVNVSPREGLLEYRAALLLKICFVVYLQNI